MKKELSAKNLALTGIACFLIGLIFYDTLPVFRLAGTFFFIIALITFVRNRRKK